MACLVFWGVAFLYPGVLFSQNIEINFPEISNQRDYYAYLIKPHGTKNDTLSQSEFINGVSKLNCKDFPSGIYRLGITGSEEATFLLLGKSNISISYQLGEASTPEPVFENSGGNGLLQQILIQDKHYNAQLDSLSQIAHDSIYEFDPKYNAKADSMAVAYNHIHEQHNATLDAFARQTKNDYLSQVLIPVLKFSTFNKATDKRKYDNERSFQHYEFFRNIDFSRPQLAGDYFFEKKLVEYIYYFGGRSPKARQESCFMLIKLASVNPDVQTFVAETLMETYFKMKDLDMVEFVNNEVNATSCKPARLSEELKKYLDSAVNLQPGKKAPDIALKNPAGEYRFLSVTAKAHQYTIVLFWASWCPHCMEMLPGLLAIYPELKAKGIEVFAISLDDNSEEWVHALSEYNIPWINISEGKRWDAQVASDYNIRATPTFFLLSNEMKIIGRYNVLENLKSALPLN